MASLFGRDRTLAHSRRDSHSSTSTTVVTMPSSSSAASSRFSTAAKTTISLSSLPSPFGNLTSTLSISDLRETAYEIFVAACRTFTGKPLTYISNNSTNTTSSPTTAASNNDGINHSQNSNSPSLQRSLTSTAASKMKKALGLRTNSSLKKGESSPGSGSGGKGKKAVTVGELMRIQMRVSESVDSRIRRALLRVSAGQTFNLESLRR